MTVKRTTPLILAVAFAIRAGVGAEPQQDGPSALDVQEALLQLQSEQWVLQAAAMAPPSP